MWGNEEDKVPKYLFGTFCFYLLYFVFVILYLKAGAQWLIVPASSFVLSLFVLKFYHSNIEIQAYAVSVLTYINIVAYGLIFHEFTETFTVFCVAVCLISFYHVPKANYVMSGLITVYIVYELVWPGKWQDSLWRDSFVAVAIRIFSVYLVQFLLIMLIKRQQMMQRLVEQKAREAEAAAQAKEDFLANMSHEIRTPMNTITGMVELALRNDLLTDQDKEYLYHIQAAGQDLLSIIDDILDITKIDSGNLEITEEAYEITPMIHDLVNVAQVMLGEKQVILQVDVNPDIPVRLCGDGVRIKQIILNLLTNAMKYTDKGTIYLKVDFVPAAGEGDRIDLKICVEDTGIGMTEEQLDDLFMKFQQADSGNRARGGNGLGLAISKRLIELMQGQLSVTSNSGKGSRFMFTVKQQVLDIAPSLETEPKIVCELSSQNEDKAEGESCKEKSGQAAFTAPSARVLLVDDNKVNLKVAEGLLRPYKMCIETADSGRQAIEMVRNRIYDLIFMDHMMPQMDGIEAAGIIRGMEGEYFRMVPIIALSANAVRGAKEMFLEAGLNDFVAKPIEMRIMDRILRRWLPEEKMIFDQNAATAPEEEIVPAHDTKINPLLWQMEGIDVVVGMQYSGEDADLYREILTDYMDTIEEKAGVIEQAVKKGDIETYTIEVHSLKSISKSIGAVELSTLARDLEENGKNKEWGPIIARTPALLSMYRELYHVIMPYRAVREQDALEKQPIDGNKLAEWLGRLSDSLNMYDSIQAEEIIEELSGHDLEDCWSGHMQAVSEMIGQFDYDACKERVALWRRELGEKMQEAAGN